jgi:hypothetical protein
LLWAGNVSAQQIVFFNIPDGNITALKNAIAASNTDGKDDIIILATNGTYTLTSVDNITAEGGNGLPAIGADNGTFVTIQGQGATIRRSASPPVYFRILEATQGAHLNVNSLTITGGYWLPNAGARAEGGGVLCVEAFVTLTDCIITGNTVRTSAGSNSGEGDIPGNTFAAAGGGVCNSGGGGILTITRCTFTSNFAIGGDALPDDFARGGAHAFGGAATFATTLTDCTFTNNAAIGGAGIAGTSSNVHGGAGGSGLGGAVSFAGAMSNCTFADNSAVGGPGGAAGDSDSLHHTGAGGNAEGGGVDLGPWVDSKATNCSFNDNSVTAGTGQNPIGAAIGGGLLLRTSTNSDANWRNIMTVTNCTLSGNSASPAGSGYGGGLYIFDVISRLSNCTFAGNNATAQGGAMVFQGNTGVQNTPAQLTLFNCTFSANDCAAGYTFYATDREADFANNIFKAGSVVGNLGGSVLHSLGHNISDDNGGGFLTGPGDMISTNPQFDSNGLHDNGGPTLTIGLLANSPAINAGDDTRAPSRDQRSYARNGVSDIGAYELNGALTPLTAVSRKNHAGTDFDLNLPLTGSTVGVECRRNTSADTSGSNAGHDHQVIVTFPYPVTIDSATGDHAVTADPLPSDFNQVYTVNLHNVPNAKLIMLSLNGVRDNTNTFTDTIPMGVLLGDVNGDGFVLSGDYTAVRQRSGATVGPLTFQYDINADGFILSGDYTTVRQQSGSQLSASPPSPSKLRLRN